MGNEWSNTYLLLRQKLQKGIHVARFGPAYVPDGVVATFLFVRCVVAAGAVRAGNAEVEFLFVICPALNVDADCAHRYDDGALSGDGACEVHGIAAGSFCSDKNCIDADPSRLLDAKIAKLRSGGR